MHARGLIGKTAHVGETRIIACRAGNAKRYRLETVRAMAPRQRPGGFYETGAQPHDCTACFASMIEDEQSCFFPGQRTRAWAPARKPQFGTCFFNAANP